jgi:hypothetical protein
VIIAAVMVVSYPYDCGNRQPVRSATKISRKLLESRPDRPESVIENQIPALAETEGKNARLEVKEGRSANFTD